MSDEKGLRLLIKPNGSKYWRLKYRFMGKQKTLALGVYPTVSLKEAREKVLDAKRLLSKGVDPSLERKQEKQQARLSAEQSFSALAREWWEHHSGGLSENHAARIWSRLKTNSFQLLGERPIADILPGDVITVIRQVESRGAMDVAKRVLQDIRRVCAYAVQTGRLTHNPASELSGVLKATKSRHRASLPREELPIFLDALETYDKTGRLLTKLALKLLLLTFVRPGELRGARWEELELDDARWRIPGDRMKMGTEHIVPLSKQALAVIEQIRSISGQYALLFPSEKERSKSMSDNTMRKAIFKLGFDGNRPDRSKANPHGFRATASSILNESGFNPDAIERQLSHQERNGVRAAYIHHARHLEERTEMMQWWADYLDGLRSIGASEPERVPKSLEVVELV